MSVGPSPAGLPPGSAVPAARGEAPPVVRRAVRSWRAAVLLGVLMSIVGFATGFFRITADASVLELARLLQGVLVLVFATISVVWWMLLVALANRLARGRSYARPWLTALGALALLMNVGVGFFPGLFTVGSVPVLLLLLAQTVTVLVALTLMYRPAASAFLAPRVDVPTAAPAPPAAPRADESPTRPATPAPPSRGPLDP